MMQMLHAIYEMGLRLSLRVRFIMPPRGEITGACQPRGAENAPAYDVGLPSAVQDSLSKYSLRIIPATAVQYADLLLNSRFCREAVAD
jgi:hypothetical protein